jgi:HK97 gp10 family phage protein
MATKVRVDGLRELERALAELPKATGKNVLRRVLLKRGQPVADAMQAMAPDDPRTGGKDLKSSIGVSTKLSKRQAGLHRKMFANDKAAVEVFVGAGALPQAHLQEFGTAHHGPQPFARPAWDAGKGPLLDGLKDDIWAEIKKAAERLAKKQAKAAKGG